MGIQIDKTGMFADPADVERSRVEFQASSYARLPKFFGPRFLDCILDLSERGHWKPINRKGFDSCLELSPGSALDVLYFVINWPNVLDIVHRITGCGPFSWFDGHVYRMAPDAGHHDEWHTDNTNGRLVAMSVNLSLHEYEGGLLQIRGRGAPHTLCEVANVGLGDALLFRISENLVHRVTEVHGTSPKTAFAGWFYATQPSLLHRLHDQSAAQTLVSIKRNH